MLRPLHLLLLLPLASCGAGPDSLPRPRSERVQVEIDPGPAEPGAGARPFSGAWARHGRGEPGTFVLSEVRDAWVAEPAKRTEFALGPRGALRVTGAVCVLGGQDGTGDSAQLEFELLLARDGHEEPLAQRVVSLRAARHAWTAFDANVRCGQEQEARLCLVSRALGADALPAGLKIAWSVPRIELVPAAGTPAEEARPNLLLISVDTLRADHLGCYGYARPTSPNIDALAARGVLFEDLVSAAPWTLPSYGTLFTGLLPTHHRAGIGNALEAGFGEDKDQQRGQVEHLAPSVSTMAESLAHEGYRTIGIFSNPFLDARSGIDRGFERWVHYVNHAQAAVELAQRALDENSPAPWFLFVHMIDPHAPYTPPSPWDERFARRKLAEIPGYPPLIKDLRAQAPDEALQRLLLDLYDGEIGYTDEQVGRLLAALEARHERRPTLVVFHSDHGEEFWEHGSFEHGHSLHAEVVHVPWILCWPGHLPAGLRIPQRIGSADVFPTLLELLGVAVPASLDGQSVVQLVRGKSLAAEDCISEALLYGPREFKALSRDGWKLISDGARSNRLYEFANDRGEASDRAAQDAPRVQELGALLRARHAHDKAYARLSGALELSPAELERLKSLGYSEGRERK